MIKFKPMRKIEAVIFDFDDTLVKTRAVKTRQHQHVAKRYYGLELSEADVAKYYGLPIDLFMQGVYRNADTAENLRKVYASHSAQFPTDLQDGALEALHQLHDRGLKLGIVTAVSTDILMKDLARFDFPYEYFVMIQGAEHTSRHKPDPAVFEPILSALAQAGVAGELAMYVGDSLSDYVAARDAGLKFTAVTTGIVTASEFAKAGAVNILDSLSGLAEIVDK